jgi:hypothetical protein
VLGFLEIKKLTLVIFLLDRRSHLVGLIHVEAHLTDWIHFLEEWMKARITQDVAEDVPGNDSVAAVVPLAWWASDWKARNTHLPAAASCAEAWWSAG